MKIDCSDLPRESVDLFCSKLKDGPGSLKPHMVSLFYCLSNSLACFQFINLMIIVKIL